MHWSKEVNNYRIALELVDDLGYTSEHILVPRSLYHLDQNSDMVVSGKCLCYIDL